HRDHYRLSVHLAHGSGDRGFLGHEKPPIREVLKEALRLDDHSHRVVAGSPGGCRGTVAPLGDKRRYREAGGLVLVWMAERDSYLRALAIALAASINLQDRPERRSGEAAHPPADEPGGSAAAASGREAHGEQGKREGHRVDERVGRDEGACLLKRRKQLRQVPQLLHEER